MSEDIGLAKEFQRSMNPKTLKSLLDNGADLSRSHDIVNVFYIFKPEDILPFVTLLGAEGFSIPEQAEQSFEQGEAYWVVEALIQLVPELSTLNRMTDQCVEIASRFNADYDGWYTQVVPVVH